MVHLNMINLMYNLFNFKTSSIQQKIIINEKYITVLLSKCKENIYEKYVKIIKRKY